MKKIFYLLAFILTLLGTNNAQNLIALEHSGINSFYTNIDTVISKAVNGDKIYLSGGGYTLNKPIDKSLQITGAGYFVDSSNSTSITILNGISIKKGADGGSIVGCYINGQFQFGHSDTNNADINGYKISRCYINGNINFLSNFGTINRTNLSTNITITETILQGHTTGNQFGTIFLSNCILNGTITLLNSQVQNNIFLYYNQFYNGLAFFGINCIVKNNVFFMNHYMRGENNQYYNNIGIWNNGIYTGTYATNSFGSGNFTKPWDSIFVNSNSTTPFNYPNNNFQLRVSSDGKNAGNDGTDIGIYGGNVILPKFETRGLVKKNTNFTKPYDKTNEAQIQRGIQGQGCLGGH